MNYGQFNKMIYQCYEVFEMNHARRINGVIDVFKRGNIVFDNVKKKMHKFANANDAIEFALSKIKEYPRKGRNELPKDSRQITYRMFKEKVLPLANIDTVNAEDYHWRQNAEKTSEDHLYFLIHDNKVKIGRSKDVASRMKALQTGLSNNYACFVVANKGCIEKIMHNCFSELKITREWFHNDIRIQSFIQKRINDKTCRLFTNGAKAA